MGTGGPRSAAPTNKMSHAVKNLPTLEGALARVGSGAGFGSLVVRNGRSKTGHIYCERIDGALCGVGKRMAPHFDNEVGHEDEDFAAWLKLNWPCICRSCLSALPNKVDMAKRDP